MSARESEPSTQSASNGVGSLDGLLRSPGVNPLHRGHGWAPRGC